MDVISPPVAAISCLGIPQRPSIQVQEVPFSINILNKAVKYISWLNGTRSIKKWFVILWYGGGWLTATFSSLSKKRFLLNTIAKPTGKGTICSSESGKSRKYSPENKHSSPSKMMVGLLFIWNGLFLEGHVNFYPVLPSQDSCEPNSRVGKSGMENHLEDP